MLRDHSNKAKFDHHKLLQEESRLYKSSSDLLGRGLFYMEGEILTLRREIADLTLRYCARLGFKDVYCPILVREETLVNTGQLPKFKNEVIRLD